MGHIYIKDLMLDHIAALYPMLTELILRSLYKTPPLLQENTLLQSTSA
jgi:transcriptional antiterminator